MGTRAFVQFPIHECVSSTMDGEALLPVWGDKIGDVYVYVQFDGDVLPWDVKETITEYTLPKPKEVPYTYEQRLRALDAEIIAARLVGHLFLEDRSQGVTVTSAQPVEGFHLLVNFKDQTVTYVGRDNGTFPLLNWMERDTGIVFTYDEEDVPV